MKVLVAIDGSKYSLQALETAVKLLPENTFFTLVNCVEPVVADPFGYENYTPDEVRDINEKLMLNSQLTLKTSIAYAKQSSLEFDTKIIQGKSKREIANFAKEHAYDLIVVGSRGMNPFKGLKLGSTTYSLLHNAPCSLLVFKTDQESTEIADQTKVAFGYCDRQDSLHACELLSKFKASSLSKLYIVTVLQQRHIYGMDQVTLEQMNKKHDEFKQAILERQHDVDPLLAPLTGKVPIHYALIEGADNIPCSLSKFAKDQGCGLVVVGNKHANNHSHIVGNICLNVVYHSKVPVLISQKKSN